MSLTRISATITIIAITLRPSPRTLTMATIGAVVSLAIFGSAVRPMSF